MKITHDIFHTLEVKEFFQIEKNSKIILIGINFDEILIGIRSNTKYIESGNNYEKEIFNKFINNNKILEEFEINQYINCNTNS